MRSVHGRGCRRASFRKRVSAVLVEREKLREQLYRAGVHLAAFSKWCGLQAWKQSIEARIRISIALQKGNINALIHRAGIQHLNE